MALAPVWPRSRRRLMFYAGIFIVVLGTFHVLRKSQRSYLPSATSLYTKGGTAHQEDPCALLDGLEDVFVIVRTGSNEVRQKLPPLLNTTLPCFRHYGIWSDMEEEFAGHHIANALDEIDPDLLEHHSDFEYYRHLQEHGKETVASGEVAGWVDAPNTNFGRDTPAWKLDKWKFIPAALKAYRQSPGSKWYVFVECDMYVLWRNLLAYLSQIDASRPYYIGRQMNIASEVFAYGGAGIIVSNAAMEKLAAQHASDPRGYEKLTIDQWAGDFILSRAMLDAGIELSQIWPTLEGEMPSTLNMKTKSNKGGHLWCYYAATYHHMAPDDIYSYYDFEQTWNSANHGLARHGDIFRDLVFPQMKDRIPDWDNLSEDVHDEDVSSFAECRAVCEGKDDCVQFSLTGERTCKTLSAAKLGKAKEQKQKQQQAGEKKDKKKKKKDQKDEKDERVDSGWLIDRVEAFMDEMEASCNGEDWILP